MITKFSRLQKFFIQTVFLIACLFILNQCVVTRSELNQSPNPATRYNVPKTYNAPKPVVNSQTRTNQEIAVLETQIKSYEEQFRTMLGRIEELETKASTTGKADADRVKDLEQAMNEMLIQQEALKKELKAGQEAQAQLAAIKAKEAKEAQEASMAPTGNLELADKLFTEGKWDRAATEFQEFRKKNPKSSEISIVTYKIGVCFQELGLKSEAKTFFNNVIQSYPNSKASKFAKFRLDNLK